MMALYVYYFLLATFSNSTAAKRKNLSLYCLAQLKQTKYCMCLQEKLSYKPVNLLPLGSDPFPIINSEFSVFYQA